MAENTSEVGRWKWQFAATVKSEARLRSLCTPKNSFVRQTVGVLGWRQCTSSLLTQSPQCIHSNVEVDRL